MNYKFWNILIKLYTTKLINLKYKIKIKNSINIFFSYKYFIFFYYYNGKKWFKKKNKTKLFFQKKINQ